MAIRGSSVIEVRRVKGKGRGVFARRAIAEGDLIESCPVLVVPSDDIQQGETWTRLGDYCFDWGKGTMALALGFGSLYNHSYQPNARYEDVSGQTKIFVAIRDIDPGEEITVNYNGEPDDRSPMWFDVIENDAEAPASE